MVTKTRFCNLNFGLQNRVFKRVFLVPERGTHGTVGATLAGHGFATDFCNTFFVLRISVFELRFLTVRTAPVAARQRNRKAPCADIPGSRSSPDSGPAALGCPAREPKFRSQEAESARRMPFPKPPFANRICPADPAVPLPRTNSNEPKTKKSFEFMKPNRN